MAIVEEQGEGYVEIVLDFDEATGFLWGTKIEICKRKGSASFKPITSTGFGK